MIFFLIALFCLSTMIPILLKREKDKKRIDDVLFEVHYWKNQVKDLEQHMSTSELEHEKLEMAKNRLSFAKNAYRVKMRR